MPMQIQFDIPILQVCGRSRRLIRVLRLVAYFVMGFLVIHPLKAVVVIKLRRTNLGNMRMQPKPQ
jgi:hypothetical protein